MNMQQKSGLETIYNLHHDRPNKKDKAILVDERGSWLRKWIGKGKKVLDIGCRDGELTKTYCDGNSVLGLDIDSEALARAKEKTGIETRHGDLNAEWGVENDAYDAVVGCEVVEHLYYPDIVFKKVKDALKDGGVFVGSIPHAFTLQVRILFLFGEKGSTPLSDPTHINQFSYKEFSRLLNKQFDDVEIVGIMTPRYSWLRPLFPYLFAHTLLFKCTKKPSNNTRCVHEQ